jgi:hypothetical protein
LRIDVVPAHCNGESCLVTDLVVRSDRPAAVVGGQLCTRCQHVVHCGADGTAAAGNGTTLEASMCGGTTRGEGAVNTLGFVCGAGAGGCKVEFLSAIVNLEFERLDIGGWGSDGGGAIGD